jgi:iron complex outermembrane receptor protein
MRISRDGSPRLSLAAMLLFLAPAGGINPALADTASVPVTTDAQQKKDEVLSEVVVTGSRIARPESERLQPTTVITSDTLEKRAITNVSDALSELPAFGQPDNSLVGQQSGFGVGQSFANFFSLGSQRTLTLVDGRRFVPANSPSIFGATGSGGEQVDLDSIPTQLIDRVEAVAVGGAPIYGSDAIAGTVNIILKHNYEGLDVDAQGGTSTHGDTSLGRVRALAGKNFDDGRGNVELNVEYADLRGLSATQRPQYTNGISYLEPPTPARMPTSSITICGSAASAPWACRWWATAISISIQTSPS